MYTVKKLKDENPLQTLEVAWEVLPISGTWAPLYEIQRPDGQIEKSTKGNFEGLLAYWEERKQIVMAEIDEKIAEQKAILAKIAEADVLDAKKK